MILTEVVTLNFRRITVNETNESFSYSRKNLG